MAKNRGPEDPAARAEAHRLHQVHLAEQRWEAERVAREHPHLRPGAPAQEPNLAIVAEMGNLPRLRRAARDEGLRHSRRSKAGSVMWRVGAALGLVDAALTGAAAAADWDDGLVAGTVGGAAATTTLVGGVVKFFRNRASSDDYFRRARVYGDMIGRIRGGVTRSSAVGALGISGDSDDATIAARVAEVSEVIKRKTKEQGAHRLPLRQERARRRAR
jgi:hypothetical protein